MVRHPLTTDQAADEPKCSRAVTCGSICYISAILPSGGKVVAEDAQEEAVSKEYKAQSEDVSMLDLPAQAVLIRCAQLLHRRLTGCTAGRGQCSC